MTGPALALFGALPPPTSGMEVMTAAFIDCLRREATEDWIHIDTSISRSTAERQRVGVRKPLRMLRQLAPSVWAAALGATAYYPVSQSCTGLIRDLILLTPFRVLRRRMVLHLHGSELEAAVDALPLPLNRALGWLIGGPRTEAIVLTPALRRCFSPWLPAARIHVLPNSVSVPAAGEAVQAREPPPLRVLFIGNVDRAKGYRELVLAVEALAGNGTRIELMLAGDPTTPADRDWLAARGTAVLRLAGHLEAERKWAALRRAHVVAMPSLLHEGQPVSILEGMACGCAIVATATGGVPETVEHEREGLLIRLPQSQFLAPASRRAEIRCSEPLRAELEAALRALADNPSRLKELRRGARARFEHSFAPDAVCQRWLEMVMPERGRRGQSAI